MQGIGSDKAVGDAALVTTNPKPGRWEIDVMLKLTESGKTFTQQVHGTVGYDKSDAVAYNLPAAGSPVAANSSTPLFFRVTNTTGVGRTFRLSPSGADITAGAPVYLPAGASALLTATLKPTAAAGTAVSGVVNVVSNTSNTNVSQTIAVLPYGYTVGAGINP